MTGREYIGEVMTQVWPKSRQVIRQTSESLKKYFRGSCKLPPAHEKVCHENEKQTRKRNEDWEYFVGSELE